MRLLANYHTHTALCGHAEGMSEPYVLEAIRKGLQEIGFSDHGPIPRFFMTAAEYHENWLERQMDERAFETVYLPDLDRSIRRFGQVIHIRKGLEIEYLPGHDEHYQRLLTQLDYLSLGVHYFPSARGIYNTYWPMDADRITEYAKATAQALDTGYFTILNHPDLFLMNYQSPAGILIFDPAARAATVQIIEAAIRNGVYLEINGGGPRRGRFATDNGLDYLYPRTAFWRIVESYPEAKVIIGCDTHNPPELYDRIIEDVVAFASRFSFHVSPLIDFVSERRAAHERQSSLPPETGR